MPLGDILGAQSDGAGGFGAAAAANQSQQSVAADVAVAPPPVYSAAQPDMDKRIAVARAVIPSLANDPVALAAAARFNVPTEMLPQQLLQMHNVTRQADQVAILGSMTPDAKKAIWSNLTDEQQQYLKNIGADLGGDQGGGGGFLGKVAHFVGTAAHDTGAVLTAPVRYPYRAVTAIPGVGHVVERGTHYTVGEVAHYGVGVPVKAALAAYKPIQAIPGHLVRAANAIDAEHAGNGWGDLGGTLSDAVNPGSWADAWHRTADGERYIEKDAAAKALDQIDGNGQLYSDLLNLQAGDTLDELVARKGFTPGSTEYQRAVADLYQQTNLPNAKAALQTMQRGKSSAGRDLARSVGLKPGTKAFTLVSGTGDALFSWYSDPAIVVGHALTATRAARYGLDVDKAATAAEAITQRSRTLARLYGQALETTVGSDGRLANVVDELGKPIAVKVGESNPMFERANQLILDSFQGGDTRAIKAAFPQNADMIQHLAEYNARFPFQSTGDVATFFQSLETQQAIASGLVLDLAAKVPTVPYLTRTNEVTNAIKGLGRGVIDLGATGAWLRAGSPHLAEYSEIIGAEHPGIQRLEQITAKYAARPDGATQFARDLTGRWIAEPLAKALESISTHVIKGGGALDLARSQGIEQVDRMLRMGTWAHIPSPVQDVLFDGFANGSVAMRRQIYTQFMTDMATGLGIDTTKFMELPEQATKFSQRYSAWSNDLYNDLRVALDPKADTSSMIAVPKFRQLIAASTLNSFTGRMFAKTAEGLPGHFIDRVWAPATLLRLAFIPRVVGDEALAFMLRNGPRAWAEGLATPLAYDPDKLWAPTDWMARQLGRAVPSAISDSSVAQRTGAWWGAMQASAADRVGGLAEHFVGETKVQIHANLHWDEAGRHTPDPLGRFPHSALANDPTIATSYGRVAASHGHGFLAQDVDPKLQQVLAFRSAGPSAGTSWVIPTVQGSHFQEFNRDLSWLREGEQYAGNATDLAIDNAFAGRANHMLSGSVYRPVAEELRRYAFDGDIKAVEKLFDGSGEMGSFVGAMRNLPAPMRSDLLEAIADNRAGVMEALGTRWQQDGYGSKLTDWVTSKMEGLDARQKSLLMAMADHPGVEATAPANLAGGQVRMYRGEARGGNDWGTAGPEWEGTRPPDEFTRGWFTTTLRDAEAYAGPGGAVSYVDMPIDEMGQYTAAQMAREGRMNAEHFDPLLQDPASGENQFLLPADLRAKARPYVKAGTPHGLISYSDPEFLQGRLEEKARQVLDDPELQRQILTMQLYDDVARTVPVGHVQVYGANATPDALSALQEAHRNLGAALFDAGPTASAETRAALKQMEPGFGTSDLSALQARFQRTGLGSIPISDWVHTNPEIAQSAVQELVRNATGAVTDAAALDGLHVGYNHVTSQTIDRAGQATDPLDVLGANRVGRQSYRVGNAGLAQSADYDTWLGRTLEDAKDDHARRVASELRQTFSHPGVSHEIETKDGEPITRWQRGGVHHELLNPGLDGQVEVRHIHSMPNAYPTKTIGPEPEVVGPGGLWSKVVNFGYGKVISPAIDALVRQPMFLEHASKAYEQAVLTLRPLIYNQQLEDRALGVLGGDRQALTDLGFELHQRMPNLTGDAVRKMSADEWTDTLDKWLTNRGRGLADANALIGKELDFGALEGREVARLDDGTRAALPRRSEGFANAQAANERLHAALSTMDPDEAATVFDWARHRDGVEQQLASVAGERAVKSMIPYIHDHQERSQFQELVRPFVPFQFAEEQFLKRWGRTFLYNPDAVGKAAMTFHALRDVGLIKKDAQGNDIYVVPGSQQFMDLMFKTIPHVFGMPAVVPIGSALTGSVQYSTPGFDLSGRPLQFSPLVGVPIKELAQRFPEFVPSAEKILGDREYNQSITDMVVPAQVRRFYEAATADEGNKNFGNAMTQAMAQLQAGGHGLPENATNDQIEQFTSRARNQARIILTAQAIMGFITPASPQVAYDGALAPEYQELLNSGMSIEQATSAFLQAHPDATPYTVFQTKVPSKAQLPTTHEALQYLVNNRGFVDKYPSAGSWLLPQSKATDGFEYAAYQQELQHGMRVQKTPKDWVNDALFAEAAPTYFDSKDNYDRALDNPSLTTTQRAAITKGFQSWKAQYEQMHPVFAEQVSLRGEESKMARGQVRRELTLALADPDLPGDTQSETLQTLLASFDNYQGYLDGVAGDQRGIVTRQKKAVANGLLDWGTLFVKDHPEARAFWERIIKPDIAGG